MAETAAHRNMLAPIADYCGFNERGVGSSHYNSNLPPTPPTPEQSIIESRGLQKKPATYKYDAPDPVFFKTPTKSPKKTSLLQRLYSPVKTPTRSSPRKRLNLACENLSFNEDGLADLTISSKRIKREPLKNVKPGGNLESNLKALSHSQLVELIGGTMKKSQDIKVILEELIPEPDLSPIDARLCMLQKTVNKSFPRNVWGSQDSSYTFSRVRSHLEAFKKECLEYLDQFFISQHWPVFFEFVFIALKYVMLLPDWSTTTHNRAKMACLKHISNKFICALQKADLDRAASTELISRLIPFEDEDIVKNCIIATSSYLKKLP